MKGLWFYTSLPFGQGKEVCSFRFAKQNLRSKERKGKEVTKARKPQKGKGPRIPKERSLAQARITGKRKDRLGKGPGDRMQM